MHRRGESAARAAGEDAPGAAWFDDQISEADLDTIADYFHRPDPHLDTLLDARPARPRGVAGALCVGAHRRSGADEPPVRATLEAAGPFHQPPAQDTDGELLAWHIIDPADRAGGISSCVFPRGSSSISASIRPRGDPPTRITNVGSTACSTSSCRLRRRSSSSGRMDCQGREFHIPM